ncbi:hypothetical protein ACFPLB_16450 [Aquamicrobium segne]|uniref:Uncharacterized protein n=1 Tax=Aquamicrobium segne TaxID=469547 RepID=A0ABW0H2E0_9HYPH
MLPPFKPADVRNIVTKVMEASPSDVRLVAQRLHDHAVEERLSGEDTLLLVRELGYESLEAFCAGLQLPAHIAERWARFGISVEMRQVLTLLVTHRRQMDEAVREFEDITHAGLDDFLRERGLI